MIIVQIITSLSHGGAENHLLSLARGLIAAGHELHIVYLKGDGSLLTSFLRVGCFSVTKIPFERPSQILFAIYSLTRLFRKQSPQIIHTHLLKANVLGGVAARFSVGKRTVIATKHNDEHYLHRTIIGLLHGLVSWLCDSHVIAVSDHVARFVHTYGYIQHDKITRIYNGFDRQLYSEKMPIDVRREFNLPTDSVVFGIVGRVTPQKNQLFLIRAFVQLMLKHKKACLLIVGGAGYSGAYYKRVKQEIGRLKLERKVVMTGWRADAFNIIGGLDCMILSSAWEGLGMVLLEAISQGVPVIATRVSAIPEVVRDGVDGLLVEPGNVAGLTAAMEEMVQRRAEFVTRLQSGGLSYVDKKFAVYTMLTETLRVYQAGLSAITR